MPFCHWILQLWILIANCSVILSGPRAINITAVMVVFTKKSRCLEDHTFFILPLLHLWRKWVVVLIVLGCCFLKTSSKGKHISACRTEDLKIKRAKELFIGLYIHTEHFPAKSDLHNQTSRKRGQPHMVSPANIFIINKDKNVWWWLHLVVANHNVPYTFSVELFWVRQCQKCSQS